MRPDPDERPHTTCTPHGRRPWAGHVVCTCGRVYQTHAPRGRFYAPPYCACRARLTPRGPEDRAFSARALCDGCYHQRVQFLRGVA